MMTGEELAAVKRYMQIAPDDTGDDALITALYGAATDYLTVSGVPPPASAPSARYNLALWGLVLHWFDHREGGETPAFPPQLRPLINQLKLEAMTDAAALEGSV